MSSHNPHETEDDAYLNAEDAGEEVVQQDEDHPMSDEDDDAPPQDADQGMNLDNQEIILQNDSVAHFDHHTDSLFCIAQHPVHDNIVVTGSGDDSAWIFDSSPTQERPLLPASYEADPQPRQERKGIEGVKKLDGHTDSVNAVAFTEPRGQYVVSAGLDGKFRAWRDTSPEGKGSAWEFVAEAQEVEEINWVAPCPCASDADVEEKGDVVAMGANDGSVWVFKIDYQDAAQPISIIQSFFQHTESCTAGAWTPDGKLLATVSEDASFYVYDVFGAAAAVGVSYSAGSSAVVGLTGEDQRFAVDGGLYSVAIAPSGAFAAVGGAEGNIKIVGLPRLPSSPSAETSSKAKTKASAQQSSTGASAAGSILASLQAQTDGIETLSFSSPPLNLLAAGSVDGSIALFDTAHRFAVRRHIKEAHETSAVVKVEFLPSRGAGVPLSRPSPNVSAATGQSRSYLLTSVGMDGVVRRWDARGGTAAAAQGLLAEWKGHAGLIENTEGEQSGGILGFVQKGPEGNRVVTAGDDGIALVFEE